MDELTLRYREACEQDDRRPSDSVREAVHAHARMMIAARLPDGGQAEEQAEARPAANQSRWKMSLLASVALAGLTSLLVLQFDRGTQEEKELGLGHAPGQVLPPVSPPMSNLPLPTLKTAPAQDVATATAVLPPITATTQPKAPKVASVAPAPVTAATTAAAAPQTTEATPPPTLAEAPPAARAQESADAQTSENTPAPSAQGMAPNTVQAPAQAPAAAPAPAPAAKQELARSAAGQAQRARLNADLAPPAPASLHDMARMGQLAGLDRLLAEGAAVNAPDATGKTPLMLAVINGHVAAVRRLLAAGANPALADREGLTALQHARRLGRDDIVRLLEERL
ncbi:MAG: ankyrin repeat domain-containing protein [Rhodoferax sp.]|nr:ankyrin repeat domain-containing protein [Rhodoferax sp.]MBP6493009.1 ankyrin repeat domain-containing protein [Rhodoferax sp.]MBP7572461.1 ankyrin repeat domain-containing protein [Rhodoferax sp.]